MLWIWQHSEWPELTYDPDKLTPLENQFLYQSGQLHGSNCHIDAQQQKGLLIDLMCDEAINTAQIEGEHLNRDSLRSSIRRQLGLGKERLATSPAEQGMAEMMVDLYQQYNQPLSENQLFQWHNMIMQDRWDLDHVGCYRSHAEAMQIVSGSISRPRIHYEAPPSKQVPIEMTRFMQWFTNSAPDGRSPLPALTRAGIAHLYFLCIHPFEDGNGRIGRAIVLKSLSQCLEQPTLIALSTTIEHQKKAYYQALADTNHNPHITNWLIYFAQTILAAQNHAKQFTDFLIAKGKLYQHYQAQLNPRQHKVIARILREGLSGFEGGLSAHNYIRITQTSPSTATRDLQALVKIGVMTQTGAGKGRRYHINLTPAIG